MFREIFAKKKITRFSLWTSFCKMFFSGASSRECSNWPKFFLRVIEAYHNGNPFVAHQILKKVEFKIDQNL